MAGRIRVQVLGNPRVLLDDVEVKIGARSTLLLLRLVVAKPATIDRDRLRNDVWWDTEGSDGALRVQVNRVRAALGRDVIVSNADGYRIGAEVAVDAERFERLCVAGRPEFRAESFGRGWLPPVGDDDAFDHVGDHRCPRAALQPDRDDGAVGSATDRATDTDEPR